MRSVHVKVKFGVGPFKWGDTYPEPCNAPIDTQFFHKKPDNLNWDQYSDQLAAEAGPLGLTFDEETLSVGKRFLCDPESRTVQRKCRIRNVPSDYDDSEVKGLLEAPHFANVDMQNHHRSGKRVDTWDFTATVPREFTMVEISQQYGDETYQMVAWAVTPFKTTAKTEVVTRIKGGNFKKPSNASTDSETAQAASSAATGSTRGTSNDTDSAGAGSGDAAMGGTRGTSNDTESVQEPVPKRGRVGPPANLEIDTNKVASGECAPAAIAKYFVNLRKTEMTADKLRLLLAGTLKKNAARYQPLWNRTLPNATSTKADADKTFEDYATSLAGPGTWWGYLELHAISYKCGIPLVLHESSKSPVLINKSSKQPYCHLWKHGQHLAWLAGTASDECKAFLATAAQEPPYAGGRFGGKVAGSMTSAQKSCGSFKTIARSPAAKSSSFCTVSLPSVAKGSGGGGVSTRKVKRASNGSKGDIGSGTGGGIGDMGGLCGGTSTRQKSCLCGGTSTRQQQGLQGGSSRSGSSRLGSGMGGDMGDGLSGGTSTR